MRSLITGGCGFIGSHLAEELIARGDHVYVIDNLSTGSIENIYHLKGNPRFHYEIDDIFNVSKTAELVDLCDRIFHLAAAVGVMLIVENPVKTIETNVHGTEVILNLAAKKKKQVILTSTSEVYGKSEKVPFKEDDDLTFGSTTKARWSYGCSKAIDEFLALSYFKEYKLPIVIARLFNTVGRRQVGHYGMVIPRFVSAALKGEPIRVYGDGRQIRCFSHVKDVVRALVKLAETSEANGEIFNVGSDEQISILDLAKKIKDKTKSNSEIVFVPYEQAYESGFEDLQVRIPDLTKIRKVIGYKPQYSLDSILDDIIDYQLSRLKNQE